MTVTDHVQFCSGRGWGNPPPDRNSIWSVPAIGGRFGIRVIDHYGAIDDTSTIMINKDVWRIVQHLVTAGYISGWTGWCLERDLSSDRATYWSSRIKNNYRSLEYQPLR